MANYFIPARFPTGSSNILGLPVKTGETFKIGAVLIFDAGEVKESGADPAAATVVGIAAAAAFTNPGYDVANSDQVETYTGRSAVQSVHQADRTSVFSGLGTEDSGATFVTPADANVGVYYGLVKAASGIWYIDISDTTNDDILIVDYDRTGMTKKFFFKFAEAILAIP